MSEHDPSASTEPTGRGPRRGVGGAPFGSTVSIVLAVVAVVLGFLILQNITDDGDGGGVVAPIDTVADTTVPAVETTPPPTTEPPLVTDGATVIVANASGVGGSAGAMTDELAAVGFTMGTPTNATSGLQEASTVHFDASIAAAESVAESVARVMGGLAVEPVPDPVPIDEGTLDGAGVLVLLGTDEAGQSLDDLQPAAAPTVTAPPVAGGTTVAPGTDDG
jgi:hypothetical protein